ncbi:MAG: VOC family protein [Anaerolineales bacterium]|nr:VOC family protein [Anaerolineales bacterium]
MQKFTPFLMFDEIAEEAINFYASIFPQTQILNISRYGSEGPGPEGSVIRALFSLNNQEFMCIDSYVEHAFTFTPSFSIFVQFETEEELDQAYARLFEGGQLFMPTGNDSFSPKFAWGADKYGVSSQLNLENR